MTKDEVIRETKGLRHGLDIRLHDLKNSKRVSRERSLAATKIQEAIMWLGMDLKMLNDGESCYKHGYDPASTEIEPTADGLKM